MPLLPVQEMPRNGDIDALTFTAADAGLAEEYPNDGRTMLICRNKGAAPRTITVASTAEPAFGRTGDLPIVVPAAVAGASGIGMAGPLARSGFNAADGNVDITADALTDLDYAVVRFKDGVP